MFKNKKLNLKDYSINYIEKGHGETVLLIHGGIGDYRSWKSQIDTLSEDFKVVAYSCRYSYPNVQKPNKANDYSIYQHVKDLLGFIKTLNLNSVHLVGHSYGAFIATLLAFENPKIIKTLTLGEPPIMSLLDKVPNGKNLSNDFITNTVLPTIDAFKNKDDSSAVKIFANGVMADENYFRNIPQELQNIMMDNAFGLKGILFSENPYPLVSHDEIKKIDIPVHLIMCEKSPNYLHLIIKEMAKLIKNSHCSLIKETSHGMAYENPEVFNRIVLEYLHKSEHILT